MTEGHGTPTGYRTRGCRCGPCTEAHRRRQQRNATRAAARGPLPPGDPRHGRQATYTYYRCRCGPCTTANADASAAYRARR